MRVKLEFPRFALAVADVGRHLPRDCDSVRAGPSQFLGDWPDRSPGAAPVRIAAEIDAARYGDTKLAEGDLRHIEVRYADDRTRADAARAVPVGELLARLRRPENRVPDIEVVFFPGGECLTFPPPLRLLMFRGAEARGPALELIDDPDIRNEIALLLGAVGDEATVPELIARYPRDAADGAADPAAWLARVCFSYALCWLTGEPVDRGRSGTVAGGAALWEAWWATNRAAFRLPAEKPRGTWVPAYPVLADDRIDRIRAMFAGGGGDLGIEFD